MQRQDAERAVRELDGFDWNGNTLRVTWSKPVPIPKRATYGECDVRRLSTDCTESLSRTHQQTRDFTGDEGGPRDKPQGVSQNTSFDMAENLERKQYWLGCVEADQQQFLEAVAKRVQELGKGLLNTLRISERSNPKFDFLFDTEVRLLDWDL